MAQPDVFMLATWEGTFPEVSSIRNEKQLKAFLKMIYKILVLFSSPSDPVVSSPEFGYFCAEKLHYTEMLLHHMIPGTGVIKNNSRQRGRNMFHPLPVDTRFILKAPFSSASNLDDSRSCVQRTTRRELLHLLSERPKMCIGFQHGVIYQPELTDFIQVRCMVVYGEPCVSIINAIGYNIIVYHHHSCGSSTKTRRYMHNVQAKIEQMSKDEDDIGKCMFVIEEHEKIRRKCKNIYNELHDVFGDVEYMRIDLFAAIVEGELVLYLNEIEPFTSGRSFACAKDQLSPSTQCMILPYDVVPLPGSSLINYLYCFFFSIEYVIQHTIAFAAKNQEKHVSTIFKKHNEKIMKKTDGLSTIVQFYQLPEVFDYIDVAFIVKNLLRPDADYKEILRTNKLEHVDFKQFLEIVNNSPWF